MNTENSRLINAQNTDPIGDAPASEAGGPAGRSRTGKIARLPRAVREQLNQRLRDGQPGKELVQWLNELPEVRAVLKSQFHAQPIGEMNLSRWRKGGYESWRVEQRALEAVNALLEHSARRPEAAKDGLTNRVTLLLTAKMALELLRLDTMPDVCERSRIWREMIGQLTVLRRQEFHGQWLRLERERINLRREPCQKEAEI